MELTKVLENLCVYDKRNPYNYISEEFGIKEKSKEERKDCYCDSCFYGRHDLAEEILKLRKVIED